jgi:hypothetical protein
VVGFTIVSRGKVPGKTCEKGREEEIIIIIINLLLLVCCNNSQMANYRFSI